MSHQTQAAMPTFKEALHHYTVFDLFGAHFLVEGSDKNSRQYEHKSHPKKLKLIFLSKNTF